MKFGILAQNSPVYQVDGENTSYFLFGDDNAKKTIGHISEDIKNNSEAQATSKIYKIDAYEMLVDHTTGGDANWFAEVIADSINENAGTLLCEAKGNDLVFNEISNIPSDKLFGEVVIKGDSWLIYTIDIENSVVSVEDGPDFEAKD